ILLIVAPRRGGVQLDGVGLELLRVELPHHDGRLASSGPNRVQSLACPLLRGKPRCDCLVRLLGRHACWVYGRNTCSVSMKRSEKSWLLTAPCRMPSRRSVVDKSNLSHRAPSPSST